MKSTLTNMLLALAGITLIAALAVAGVFELTKDPIANSMVEKTNAAIAQVMPEFDNNPSAEKIAFAAAADTLFAYPARKGEELVGYAIETKSSGFAGMVKLMVGITSSGEIHNISVLGHAETPGLGDKIEPEKSDFSLQFIGKSPSTMKMSVKKDGGDIDAITASTITSRAYAKAVEAAFGLYQKLQTKN